MIKPIHFLFLSISIFFCIYIFLYPYYGYLLDTDAVGYLTVANKYANGTFTDGVNGYWSPLNIWLIVPFIKMGFNAFTVAKALNFFFAGSVLILFYQLMQRFTISHYYQKIILLFLPIFLCYISYAQIFGDVLQLVFLLLYLLIITSRNFFGNFKKYIFCAFIMVLAFYAKTYNIIFFILHFTAIHSYYWYKTKQNNFIKMIFAFTICILTILPWSFSLQNKYKNFNLIGNVGKLNMSWYLTSKKDFKDSIHLLIPPVDKNSPTFWEDPFLSQSTALHTPLESPKMFFKWMARIGFTCIQFINCMSEISVFCIAILLFSFYYFLKIKNNNFNLQLLLITVLVLPLGYLTMHIESRFIWLILFISIILFANIINEINNNTMQKIAIFLFCISITIYPITFFTKNIYGGKANFSLAQFVKENKINGKWTSNITSPDNLWIVAYLTKNQFYTIEKTNYTQSDLENELLRYSINYYFKYAENNNLETSIIGNQIDFTKVANFQNFDIYKLKSKITK